MSFQHIQNGCYYFKSSVNIGYIQAGDYGMLIDAGLDRSTIKKVLKELDKRELPLTHLFVSHAHADHYGGAAYIQEQREIYTIAPSFEESILRNPRLEPLYLFGGNDPLNELTNKFLQGPSMRVDEVVTEGTFLLGEKTCTLYLLPGHSYHQLALKVDGVLYAADSYFGLETLKKHKIPFITEAQSTLGSLERLLSIECEGAVPGHGEFEQDPSDTIQANISCHLEILEWMYEHISSCPKGISHEQMVSNACRYYEVHTPNLSQWLLYRTAITGYLIGLIKHQKVDHSIEDGRWVLKANDI